MTRFLLICLGGAIGTGCRYLTVLGAARTLGTSFPYGTLAVNVAGSLLLGFIMQAAVMHGLNETLRLALTTGVMGGFTTYSTFNYETTHMLRDGFPWLAALNMSVTLIGCLVAGVAGMALGRLLLVR